MSLSRLVRPSPALGFAVLAAGLLTAPAAAAPPAGGYPFIPPDARAYQAALIRFEHWRQHYYQSPPSTTPAPSRPSAGFARPPATSLPLHPGQTMTLLFAPAAARRTAGLGRPQGAADRGGQVDRFELPPPPKKKPKDRLELPKPKPKKDNPELPKPKK
jgi:hypothetical protein